jgi:hypothetical protein
MTYAETPKRYFDLTIEAVSPSTDIWLADTDGHLVQKESGILQTSVLPGRYVVEFTLGGPTYPIDLNQDQRFTEPQLRAGPSCPRPNVRLLDDDWDPETEIKNGDT